MIQPHALIVLSRSGSLARCLTGSFRLKYIVGVTIEGTACS